MNLSNNLSFFLDTQALEEPAGVSVRVMRYRDHAMYPIECTPRDLYCAEWAAKRIVIESARKMLWLQTPAHNRQIVGIVLLAKSLFVAVVVSIVAAATCCQNFSSGRGCVHTRHQYGGEKNPRLGCATKKCSNHQPLHSECYGLHCAVCEAHVH